MKNSHYTRLMWLAADAWQAGQSGIAAMACCLARDIAVDEHVVDPRVSPSGSCPWRDRIAWAEGCRSAVAVMAMSGYCEACDMQERTS